MQTKIVSYRMKNIPIKRFLSCISGVYLLDNQHFTPPHSVCKYVTYPIFLLFFVFAVCGCTNDQEPLDSTAPQQLSSPAPSAGADSLMSVLEGVGSWRVMAIIQREGAYSIDLSTEGTMAYFADGEVTFAVPYTSVSFDDDSESAIEYEQYGPYPVSYQSSNTLSIADEEFRVSAMANGGYALIAENLTIEITK